MARVEELTTHALSNRPDLNAMAREIEALRADVRASQAAWFPQVSFVGNYRYARPNPYIFPQEDAFRGTWDVGVSLSMNLWAGGRTRAEARQAKAQAAQQWEDARTSVEVAVRRQVPAIQHAEVALQVSQEGLEEAEEAFRVMRARFRRGAHRRGPRRRGGLSPGRAAARRSSGRLCRRACDAPARPGRDQPRVKRPRRRYDITAPPRRPPPPALPSSRHVA